METLLLISIALFIFLCLVVISARNAIKTLSSQITHAEQEVLTEKNKTKMLYSANNSLREEVEKLIAQRESLNAKNEQLKTELKDLKVLMFD